MESKRNSEMSCAEDILLEAMAQARRRNKEAVLLVMVDEPHCSSCKYPQNALRFNKLHRKMIHIAIKYKGSLRVQRFDYGFTSKRWVTNNEHSFYHLQATYEGLKNEMKQIWPCERCIDKYNPTGRHNHPPQNYPKGVAHERSRRTEQD